MAGRAQRRVLVQSTDQNTGNASVGYADIQHQAHNQAQRHHLPPGGDGGFGG
jgi:hypothetical protein